MIGDSIDKLVDKGLALLVNDLKVGILLLHVIHDSVKKVGLTKSGVTVKEEGITVGDVVCNSVTNSLGKLI